MLNTILLYYFYSENVILYFMSSMLEWHEFNRELLFVILFFLKKNLKTQQWKQKPIQLENGQKIWYTFHWRIFRWQVAHKKCLKLRITKLENKTTIKCHYILSELLKYSENTRFWLWCRKTGPHCWWKYKMLQPHWKILGQFLIRLNLII